MRIQAKELRKSFGNRQVLKGVDLELNPGEIICITGANGAGKSTLVQILSTLLRPDRGIGAKPIASSLLINGEDPFEKPRSLRKQMGVLLHEPMLYDQLTAKENLKYISRIYRLEEGDETIERWLEKAGLIEFADQRVGDFSAGMRQRLTIARVMMHSPELLLMDEPFSSLDRNGIEMLIELIGEHLSCGGSAVVVSHMSWLLERLSTNVFHLSEGRLFSSLNMSLRA